MAPAEYQSSTSHSLSLHEPLRVHREGERRFAVRGTPGDCVAVAAGHLMREAPPELVLSGINRGANLGTEMVSRTDPRELDYHWLRLNRGPRDDAPDSETASLRAGHVTVTPLKFERTHDTARARLAQKLAG